MKVRLQCRGLLKTKKINKFDQKQLTGGHKGCVDSVRALVDNVLN